MGTWWPVSYRQRRCCAGSPIQPLPSMSVTTMSDTAQGGLLFVLSGPSGVGKDAAIAALKATGFNIYHVITATTREKRAGEEHGIHYFFHSPDEFTEMIRRGELLEAA